MSENTGSDQMPPALSVDAVTPSSRGTGKTIIIGIVAGVVTFFLMCGILALVGLFAFRSGAVRDALVDVTWQLDERDPFGPDGPVWMGTPNVWYCAGGDIAVAQMVDEDAQPIVVAWSEEWPDLKIAEGYRVVAVESEAPVLWLVKDSSVDFTDDGPMLEEFPDTAGDLFAQPVDDLLTWRLDSDGQPEPASKLDWVEWQGPGTASVTLHVDPDIAPEPSSATFRIDGRTIEAQLPPEHGAFEPIGWCPQGDHFAVITLTDHSTFGGGMVEFESDLSSESEEAAEEPTANQVLIIEVATGNVTSSTSVGWASEMMGSASLAAWSGSSDSLYVLKVQSPGADWIQKMDLLMITPGGESTGVGSWSDAYMAWIEPDPTGEPMMMVSDGMSTELWRLDPVKPRREESVSEEQTVVMASDWRPGHGLLLLVDEGFSESPNAWSSGGAHVFGFQDGRELQELYRVDNPGYW